jgi:hypothetical protein
MFTHHRGRAGYRRHASRCRPAAAGVRRPSAAAGRPACAPSTPRPSPTLRPRPTIAAQRACAHAHVCPRWGDVKRTFLGEVTHARAGGVCGVVPGVHLEALQDARLHVRVDRRYDLRAVAAIQLVPIVVLGVVRCRDHHPGRRPRLPHRKRLVPCVPALAWARGGRRGTHTHATHHEGRGDGARAVHIDGHVGSGKNTRGQARVRRRVVPVVVPDHYPTGAQRRVCAVQVLDKALGIPGSAGSRRHAGGVGAERGRTCVVCTTISSFMSAHPAPMRARRPAVPKAMRVPSRRPSSDTSPRAASAASSARVAGFYASPPHGFSRQRPPQPKHRAHAPGPAPSIGRTRPGPSRP